MKLKNMARFRWEKVLKELASELNVSDSQIRKWKSVDKWAEELKGNVTKSNSNVTNKMSAAR